MTVAATIEVEVAAEVRAIHIAQLALALAPPGAATTMTAVHVEGKQTHTFQLAADATAGEDRARLRRNHLPGPSPVPARRHAVAVAAVGHTAAPGHAPQLLRGGTRTAVRTETGPVRAVL